MIHTLTYDSETVVVTPRLAAAIVAECDAALAEDGLTEGERAQIDDLRREIGGLLGNTTLIDEGDYSRLQQRLMGRALDRLDGDPHAPMPRYLDCDRFCAFCGGQGCPTYAR